MTSSQEKPDSTLNLERALAAYGRAIVWFVTSWRIYLTIVYAAVVAVCFVVGFLLAPIGILLIVLIPFILLVRSIWEFYKTPDQE